MKLRISLPSIGSEKLPGKQLVEIIHKSLGFWMETFQFHVYSNWQIWLDKMAP